MHCAIYFWKEVPSREIKRKNRETVSKIDLYLCNVSNVDRDVNLKVNKVMIHGNQAIFNHIKYQQSTNTGPTENKKIP